MFQSAARMATRPPTTDKCTFTPPRAIVRVLRVIEVLATHARRLSLAELSLTLGIPKTSLFAILKGLAQSDYVAFENETYALGPRARKLCDAIAGARSFPDCARPVIEQLAHASGETVILVTLSEDRRHVIYAIVVEADRMRTPASPNWIAASKPRSLQTLNLTNVLRPARSLAEGEREARKHLIRAWRSYASAASANSPASATPAAPSSWVAASDATSFTLASIIAYRAEACVRARSTAADSAMSA